MCLLSIANIFSHKVEYINSQYSCILTSQVSTQFLCLTKLLIIVIILGKSALHSEISAILCVLWFLFLHFFIKSWKTYQPMWENLAFLLHLTLMTSCIIGPFLCCNLLYLIIYLLLSSVQWSRNLNSFGFECGTLYSESTFLLHIFIILIIFFARNIYHNSCLNLLKLFIFVFLFLYIVFRW